MTMFWDNVKEEVGFKNISYKELADKTGLLLQYLYNGISRKTTPSVDVAYKIASALGVTVEYLLTGNNLPGLNDDEMEVIRLYKTLSDSDKAMVKMVLSSVSVK